MLNTIKKLQARWKEKKSQLKKTNKIAYVIAVIVETLTIALIIALLIRAYIIQTSVVPTGSMIPTVEIGDRLLVNKYIYRFDKPKRGEIVVFESIIDDKDYVKRCIGLPGETVEIKEGFVYINGNQITIPGVIVKRDKESHPAVEIPDGHYYMLGDNRLNSYDSRGWGTVPEKNLIGKAVFTFWPFSQMRVLR